MTIVKQYQEYLQIKTEVLSSLKVSSSWHNKTMTLDNCLCFLCCSVRVLSCDFLLFLRSLTRGLTASIIGSWLSHRCLNISTSTFLHWRTRVALNHLRAFGPVSHTSRGVPTGRNIQWYTTAVVNYLPKVWKQLYRRRLNYLSTF